MSYGDMYKTAKKEKRVKTLAPKFLKFRTPGETLIGRYIGKGEVEGKTGKPYQQYVFETDEGPVKFSLGGAADNEIGNQFEEGQIYAITFKEKEDIGGGHTVNKFDCEAVLEGN